MKYCINFYGKHIDLLNTIDEINLNLSKIRKLEDLEEFCKNHSHQRINLCINDYEDAINNTYLTFAFDFQKQFKQYDIAIRLPGWDQNFCPTLKEKYPSSKMFFNIHIIDWDTLIDFLNFGVSDVYIAEAMGFELDKIAEIVHAHNTQIRVFPNVAQAAISRSPDLLKFWIRPEDIIEYENYIDVCEFYGDDEKQSVYYDIYVNDKKWAGNLNEIIIGLDTDINSRTLLPRFAKKRIKCGRQCMKGGKCHMCDRILELSKTLEKNKLQIKIEEDSDGERSRSEEDSNN